MGFWDPPKFELGTWNIQNLLGSLGSPEIHDEAKQESAAGNIGKIGRKQEDSKGIQRIYNQRKMGNQDGRET